MSYAITSHDVTAVALERHEDDVDWLDRVVRWGERCNAKGTDPDLRREARVAVLRATRAPDARAPGLRPEREQAARIWRAVVAGEWSLLDHFDAGGRRFVVARNDSERAHHTLEVLTPGERRVVAYAAKGYTNKLIGYELRLSASAVGMRIARAARRLAVRSRVELIAAYRRAQAAKRRSG